MYFFKLIKRLVIFMLLIVIILKVGNRIINTNYNVIINDNSYVMSDTKDIHLIEDIEEFNQFPNYPTGCESVALYLLLKHYDINVTVDSIIDNLDKGPIPYGDGNILIGANPEKEFVGNPYSSQSYGVYEGPIKNTANVFKSGAKSEIDATIADIEKIIDSGNPLIAWIRIYEDYSEVSYGRLWLDYETGEEIPWIRGEHAVLVYGYSDEKIFISNPYNGKKYSIDRDLFIYNFKIMGGRIVYYSK